MSYKIDLVLDAKAGCGETPIWNEKTNKLMWTDVFPGEVHIFDPATGEDVMFNTGEMIGSAIPTTSGKILVLLDSGLKILDPSDGSITPIVDVEPDKPENRLNDGRCDKKGRVWFSTVSKIYGGEDFDDKTMTGAFYMVDTDLSLHKVLDGIVQLNGIGWSKDDKRMFVADTHEFKMYQFDYDVETGKTGAPKVLFDIPRDFGFPDGITIDENENVWIGHWGSKLSRWDLNTGKLVEVVDMPVANISCPGFGGEDFDDLFINTAALWVSEEDLSKPPTNMSGGIFKIKPGVKGRKGYIFDDSSL